MWFFSKQVQLPDKLRTFQPAYFLREDVQRQFERDGFVVLNNLVTDEEIERCKEQFSRIQDMKGYAVGGRFESSGNFQSKDLQSHVFGFIQSFMGEVAPRFANLDNCEIGDGGAFFIKPNSSDESILHPHQDSAVIDESKYYAVFVWIPLQDITQDNGALCVLPGSHAWGNFQRSQHIPWAFRKHNDLLWQHLKPVYLKRGDVMIFDSSIIHGSQANHSNDYRLVVCGALLPKQHRKVDYLLDGETVVQYDVDRDYWLDGGKADSLKQYPAHRDPYRFPNPLSRKQLKQLLENNRE